MISYDFSDNKKVEKVNTELKEQLEDEQYFSVCATYIAFVSILHHFLILHYCVCCIDSLQNSSQRTKRRNGGLYEAE